MARMGHANPRTYGSKLLDPADNETKANSAVTSRLFDVEYFAATGKIRYIDEEGKDVPTVDQLANGKKLREEITTLEQFNAIGNYADVAKKYHVGVTSAHGSLKSLRVKKAKEEKQLDVKDAAGTCIPEIEETVNTSSDVESFVPDGGKALERAGEPLSEELQDEAIDTAFGKISPKTGRYICVDCGEGILDTVAVYAQSGLCQGCSEDLFLEEQELEPEEILEDIDKLIDKLDGNLTLQIGHMWEVVKSDLDIIHKLYIERAEKEYDAQLSLVMTWRPAQEC